MTEPLKKDLVTKVKEQAAKILGLEAEIAAENLADQDWNKCDCRTCAFLRAHQSEIETVDELLVAVGVDY